MRLQLAQQNIQRTFNAPHFGGVLGEAVTDHEEESTNIVGQSDTNTLSFSDSCGRG